ncbi:MAG: hypothetical protein HYX20_02260 [Candidatus Yanofskybacteria bacterium]|nr:hypothetical protein [Candidatus Yanofskybacteria bacterium]
MLSKKERDLIVFLFFITIGALIAMPVAGYYHFTKPAPDFGGSLIEGLVGTPQRINPLLVQNNDAEKDLTGLVYSGLLRYNGQGKIENGLAESYEISEDGLIYIFKLRNNLLWHDRQPLTADDVIFSVITAQNSDYGSTQRIVWQGVEVSKADDRTIIFKLKNKYAQFLSNATMGIIPKHIWEKIKPSSFDLSDFNIKPVGSGPYKFSKVRRDTAGNIKSFELAAFEKYYAGKPYISKIIFKFYQSENDMITAYNNNEIEGLGFISPQNLNSFRFLGQLKILKLRLPRYFAVFFNQNRSKQLSDKNVRLAINYATNKNGLVDKILNGYGTAVDSPMLFGIINPSGQIAKQEFGIELANKTLEDANWSYPASSSDNHRIREKVLPPPKNKKNQPGEPLKLEIKLTTSDWPELIAVGNEIKRQWETVGVAVNLEVLPLPELQRVIKERNYDALLFGEVLALDPDPFSFWHSSQKRDPGLNLALYDNKDADKLLEDARQTLVYSARLAKYDEFQKIVANEIPAVFLYSPDYLYAQPVKIKGNNNKLISMPSGRFDTVNKWYIETKRVTR